MSTEFESRAIRDFGRLHELLAIKAEPHILKVEDFNDRAFKL
ncbi:MAG: hypothetical protein V3W41_07260 [Planctomycetota bacterium]